MSNDCLSTSKRSGSNLTCDLGSNEYCTPKELKASLAAVSSIARNTYPNYDAFTRDPTKFRMIVT